MQAKRLAKGGTIGIFSPSHVADRERCARITATIEGLGYQVKLGANIYRNTYGCVASAEERAADLNTLAADDEVGMVLFSGGECAVEILPLIDYENIRRHPKLFSSYSDGTSILNAIHAQTGLTTYYGLGAGEFFDLRQYDYTQFCTHFAEGHIAGRFNSAGGWKTICGGTCRGTLIGGYAPLFGLLLANRYFHYDADTPYVLFLEDHESFCDASAVSTYLAFIEQSAFMKQVQGLILGHFSIDVPQHLLRSLERFGTRNGIPVAYTDDFGHGTLHAVLPIGAAAEMNNGVLTFLNMA